MSLSDCVPLPLPWDIYPLELIKEMTHFPPFLLLCQKRKKEEKKRKEEREKRRKINMAYGRIPTSASAYIKVLNQLLL